MVCVAELFKIGILPVTGKGILCQVVGAYAEEINHRSKLVADPVFVISDFLMIERSPMFIIEDLLLINRFRFLLIDWLFV